MHPEVYVDESYVNKNHSNDFVWYSSEDGPWIHKPTGKGERLIIMHAMTKDGWVPEAKVVWKRPRKTGDDHGHMHGDVLQKWCVDTFLPPIPNASRIRMDHASSHHILAEYSAPTPPCAQENIRTWLEEHTIPCQDECLKVERIDM